MEQIQKLTNPALGFHINALNVTAEQIEAFSMGKMEKTTEIYAPELCDLVGTLSSAGTLGCHGVWLPMALTGRICHDAQYRDT
jgi:hypothetical protein